jgi:competence protein ComGD
VKQAAQTTSLYNQRGFTLLEMLLVLTIFMMIVSLSFGMYPTFIKNLDTRLFLEQFSDDLYYSQQYAITQQKNIYFTIDIPGRSYYSYSYSDGRILQRNIPDDVKFEKLTLDLFLTFTTSGNVSSSGSWQIRADQSLYKVTVYLGAGRFRIEKL